MRPKLLMCGLAILFLFSLVMTTNGAAQAKRYVMGSGNIGSPWLVAVGAGVQMINETYKGKYEFTSAASGGSVENMRRMMAGEFHTGWVHINTMYDAWNGVGLFEGNKPYRDFRVVEFMIDQGLIPAVLAKSSIRHYKDLAGKKVNTGPPGSGGVPIAKAIFKALGLTDKVKVVNLGMEAGAQALRDGQIDATIHPGGPYSLPAVVEISRSVLVRYIEPTPDEAKKVESEASYLRLGVIPPNAAPGENSDKERKTFFWGVYWCALASMPDEVIYDVLKLTQEPKNKEVLGKVASYYRSAGPQFSVLSKLRMPLHPGAVRFWREKGVTIPPEIMPK